MHAAPPVRISLAPDVGWRAFVTACASAAAANLAAWLMTLARQSTAAIAAVALLAAVLAAGLALWGLRRDNAGGGVLAWDGAAWQWAPANVQPAAGDLHVMIDLGAWLLLRFVPGASAQPVRWLVASRRQGGALWPLWRAALFSPPRSAEPSVNADPS
ncbi:MAG: hypothetical protein Q8L49_00575 [Burkholderiaceae bacterium]|nr:hypothetical protein [Burkholderiaceae bacterium]